VARTRLHHHRHSGVAQSGPERRSDIAEAAGSNPAARTMPASPNGGHRAFTPECARSSRRRRHHAAVIQPARSAALTRWDGGSSPPGGTTTFASLREPGARADLLRRRRPLRLRGGAPRTPLRGRPGLRRVHTPSEPGSTPGPATTPRPVSRRSCRPCSAAGPGRHWDGAPRRGSPTEEARRSSRRWVEVRILPSARAPVAQRTERSASTRGRRGFESSRGRHADVAQPARARA
jgi:hypothetical protein